MTDVREELYATVKMLGGLEVIMETFSCMLGENESTLLAAGVSDLEAEALTDAMEPFVNKLYAHQQTLFEKFQRAES